MVKGVGLRGFFVRRNRVVRGWVICVFGLLWLVWLRLIVGGLDGGARLGGKRFWGLWLCLYC